ncbi:MAG TPA: Ig-like domain-containing protein [Longimicrobium sp.]|jgi:hypothetical protein
MQRFFDVRTGATRAGLLSATLALAAAGCDFALTPEDELGDMHAPKISVSHEQNATNQGTVTIGGRVTDRVGVERMAYRVNGGAEQEVSITPGATVEFTATIPVTAALNMVELIAYDAAGNRSAHQIQVMYDAEAPTLSVVQLADGGSFSSFLRLDGVANDSGSGVRRVTYRVNGGPETDITGGYKSPTSGYTFKTDAYGLPLGQNTFVVTAYDRAGNRGELKAVMTRKQ